MAGVAGIDLLEAMAAVSIANGWLVETKFEDGQNCESPLDIMILEALDGGVGNVMLRSMLGRWV